MFFLLIEIVFLQIRKTSEGFWVKCCLSDAVIATPSCADTARGLPFFSLLIAIYVIAE